MPAEFTLLILLLCRAALALSLEDTAVIVQIEALRLPPAALESFARSSDAEARQRAAVALGRLRTTEALPMLETLSTDADPAVREAAAFAFGQTPEGCKPALNLLDRETEPAVRAMAFDALGRQCGADEGRRVQPVLLAALDEKATIFRAPVMAPHAARAFGRLASRKIEGVASETTVAALLDQLKRFDAPTREAAAFALSRFTGGFAQDQDRVEATILGDRDPVVRAFLLRSTASLGLAPARRDALLEAASHDPDAGVRVAVARAAGPAGWLPVSALLVDPEVNVRLEAIGAMGTMAHPDCAALLLPLLEAGGTLSAAEAARASGSPAELLAATALGALVKAGALPHEGPMALDAWLEPARPTRLRAAAAAVHPNHETLIRLANRDGEPSVRTAAAGHLLEEEPSPPEVLALLDSIDAMVLTAACDWFTEHPTPRAEAGLRRALAVAEDSEIDLLTSALKALTALFQGPRLRARDPDPELVAADLRLMQHPVAQVNAAARALAPAFGLTPPPLTHRLFNVPLDEVYRVQTARLITTRGEAVLELYPQVAPITVWNFATLAQKGWYDGIFFHRVVPDFVVQAGDPRGDGWGGPGHSIPDELSPLTYDEGTLGMALSGPDTGGSQWFITLSPQPHLDGSYTVFGHVVSGMQVVRGIVAGDRILHVTIERSPTSPP